MLISLAVRDIVLIERLDLAFQPGLSVLTGETGAGKSILLDALGLALGARGDAALVRHRGGGDGRASVTAEFALPPDGRAAALLEEHGLSTPEPGEPLILRRTLAADGRSRAFVNDEPASVGLLRALGTALVEVEGQFASQGLLDAANHRTALDAFGGLGALRDEVAQRYGAWRAATAAREAAQAVTSNASAEEDYLRHVLGELNELDPNPGEEDALAAQRTLLMHREQLAEAVAEAAAGIGDTDGAEALLSTARRLLVRNAEKAGGRLDMAIEALDRAADAVAEAGGQLAAVASDLEGDPGELDRVEERLFALRAAARKHRTDVDQLPELAETFRAKLAAIETADDALAEAQKAEQAAEQAFVESARRLSAERTAAALRLDAAIGKELPPLKLEKAVFHTEVAPLEHAHWSEAGCDRVSFMVSPNPGVSPGPLARIASGGELARFMLALKIALNETGGVPTLVFDEVDSGVGGATAAAVGERLHRLAERHQVLVVTHSPQVAARASHHLRISKTAPKGEAEMPVTLVDRLSDDGRREEIARMLAGARVTEEARAAADSLIAGRAR